MNRRTVAFFKDLLIGRDEYLLPLLKESLKITSATYTAKTTVLKVEIENVTSAAFTLMNKSKYTFHGHSDLVTIAPGEKVVLEVKTKDKLNTIDLPFEVLNAIHAPNSHPSITLSAKTNALKRSNTD